MPDLSFLFGTPDIEKLKAGKDLAGLTRALKATRDSGIARAAAAALLSLDAYPPAYEIVVRQGGAAVADRLEADLLVLMNQPSADAFVQLRAAKFLSASRSEGRFKVAAQVLLADGKFDWLHDEMEKTGQADRLRYMRMTTEQIYTQETQPLRLRAWAAGYLLRWQEEPYAAFLLQNYQALFQRLRTIFTYDDVIKAAVPWCAAGNMDEAYQAFITCARGLTHLPENRMDALIPFITRKIEDDPLWMQHIDPDYLASWTVDILRQMSGQKAGSLLRLVLMTQPNLDIRNRAYWALVQRGWQPTTIEERLACLIASEKFWIADDIETLGIEAIPAIEAALKMPMKTGGRERDGREKRDDYRQLGFALETLQVKAQNRG